jgi:hypothetical protein
MEVTGRDERSALLRFGISFGLKKSFRVQTPGLRSAQVNRQRQQKQQLELKAWVAKIRERKKKKKKMSDV